MVHGPYKLTSLFSDEDVEEVRSTSYGVNKEDKLTVKEILSLVHLCGANFSIGLYYAMLGPFFPQEVQYKQDIYAISI